MLLSQGLNGLINEKVFLNKINVFPVPDGDTGSNMASLMQRIINDSRGYEPYWQNNGIYF